MSAWLAMAKRWVIRSVLDFRADRRGNIAIIFGLSSTLIVAGMGASVDLARAYSARQKLSQVAELTCQYSVRPKIVAIATSDYASTTGGSSSGFATYLSTVNTFASNALINQHWTGTLPTPIPPSATYFTATQAAASASSANAPTNPVAGLKAVVPTFFMQIMGVPSVTVQATINCLTASTTSQIVTSTGPSSATNYVAQETFSVTCSYVCYTTADGTGHANGPSTVTASSATTSAPGYTGDHGLKWYILGYCLEQDSQGAINAATIGSNNSVELDCDNGSGSAGNSSISTQVYLAPGRYELRYNYRARIDYPDYDPAYICGSTANDVSWANDTTPAYVGTIPSNAYRTNQMNVYLDMVTSSNVPLHTTMDGTQQLGGTNLIDVCVYAPSWVQRSVKITVTTPAYYWLSFAADGQSDSFGGQLDNILLCQETCSGTPTDAFPSTWVAANNGGVNKVLWEDSFESPTPTADTTNPHYINTTSNLKTSYGTTVSTGCSYGPSSLSYYASPPGWPCQPAAGWAAAPYNQVTFGLHGADAGSQYISLDGCDTPSTSGCSSSNRLISRPFVLDPGYYMVSYDYLSMTTFPTIVNGTYCSAAPSSGTIVGSLPTVTGNIRYGSTIVTNVNTNFAALFMSSSLTASTPNYSSTQGATTTYTNPDGTTSTTPTVAPDTLSLTNYNASQVNPVLDYCVFSDVWTTRTVYIKITKPGTYWLTLSSNGSTADGTGAGIDDVKLTAIGSPYMSGAPTSPLVAIPVPAPQPDTNYYGLNNSFNGFYIVADPFTPPAADQ